MDVRQLRNVLAIFEKGSIGKASETLRISQPALTKSLKRLEDELQVKLFERTARGMKPTVYGECLRSHAAAVNIGIQNLRSDLQSLKSGLTGIVEVGAPPIVAPRVLPEAIAELRKDRPKVLVRITTDLSPALIRLVQDGRLDFAVVFTADEVLPAGCRRRLLFDDRLVIAARAKHPITRSKRISVRDAAQYAWVLPHQDNLHRHRLQLAFEAEGLPLPRPVIECNSVETIKTILQTTDCVALISQMSVGADESGRIHSVELASEFMTRQIGLIWRDDRSLSAAAEKLMQLVDKRFTSRW